MHSWFHMKVKENTQGPKSKKSLETWIINWNWSCIRPSAFIDLRNLEPWTIKTTPNLGKKKKKGFRLCTRTKKEDKGQRNEFPAQTWDPWKTTATVKRKIEENSIALRTEKKQSLFIALRKWQGNKPVDLQHEKQEVPEN